jgi:two-component system, OmpR family, sensor kinase
MSSLRARLFVGLAVLIVIAGSGAGLLSFHWAFNEAIEQQDSVIGQMSALAAAGRFTGTIAPDPNVDSDARVVVEELNREPPLLSSGQPLPRLSATLPDGLQTVQRGEVNWRLSVRTRPDGSRVAAGQPTSSRDQIAKDGAMWTVLPFLLLLPLLMALVGVVIGRSMRPLSRLAQRLDEKLPQDLALLSLEGLPQELHPFVKSINRSLARTDALLTQQKLFVADAAHELRSPVTALSLQIGNLDQQHLSKESRERLYVAKAGIRRMNRLLTQLLALARYETQSSDVHAAIALDEIAKVEVAEAIADASERKIDLGFRQLAHVAVEADSAALSTVIRNLLENAIRHTPEGGNIDVSVLQAGAFGELRIEDSGSGISEGDLQRIYERFFRGSNSLGDGTGLGLAIVKRIVDDLRGTIVIANRTPPEHGLKVVVSLPIARN